MNLYNGLLPMNTVAGNYTTAMPSQNCYVPWDRQGFDGYIYPWWQQYPTVYPLTFPTTIITTTTNKEKSMESSPASDAPGALVETITDIVEKRFAKERDDLRTVIKAIVFEEFEKHEEALAAAVLKKLNTQLRQQTGLK